MWGVPALRQFSGKALQSHESRVTEFMKQAEADNPALFTEVCGRYSVLTERELSNRRNLEISLDAVVDWLGSDYADYQYYESGDELLYEYGSGD